jgi:hypothetical protein
MIRQAIPVVHRTTSRTLGPSATSTLRTSFGRQTILAKDGKSARKRPSLSRLFTDEQP